MSVRTKSPVVRAIPLNRLKKSHKNVRKVPHTQEEIETLAANIHATRMIQMPVVEPEYGANGRATGFYLVNVGEGRRLAQLLRVKRKQIKRDAPILCVVDSANNADASGISLAENLIRAPMHPADQFEAFKTLIDSGKSVGDVAAQFNIKPIVVLRSLKLANVHPSFIELYRNGKDGKVTMEHLMALSLTEDHEKQQQLWASLGQYHRDPGTLRRALTEGEISVRDPKVRFVGLDAYRAAGGDIRGGDLFAEGENDGYVTDIALLEQLVSDKLGKKAEQLKRQGETWVEVKPTLDYADLRSFGRVASVLREPTRKEKRQHATLAKRRAQVDTDVAEATEAQDEDRLAELTKLADELEAEDEALRAQRAVPDPEQQAAAGAVVAIDHTGKLRIERGLLRPEDVKRLTRASKNADNKGAADETPRMHSESLVRRLTAHRTVALQAVLAERPDVALVALTHRLAEQTFFAIDGRTSAVQIQARAVSVRQHAPDVEGSKAHQALAVQQEAWEHKLPAKDLFAWLLDQPQTEVLALLAFCVAVTVDAVEHREGESDADPLARAVALDMREWWTATAEGYFGSVPKARILAVVTEAVSPEAAVPLAKMPKKTLAEAAARIISTGWLPEPLRTCAA